MQDILSAVTLPAAETVNWLRRRSLTCPTTEAVAWQRQKFAGRNLQTASKRTTGQIFFSKLTTLDLSIHSSVE